jgi:uncharacterized membrane protein YgdD (TMEM256/DUF423 family)
MSGGRDASVQLRQIAAFLGASGVTLGAFGAHAMQDALKQRGKLDNWRTAVLYQLFHAAAIVGVSALASASDRKKESTLLKAGQLLGVGTIMFSGSIYLLCLEKGPKKILGPTTPLGGLLMIGGWVMLGMSG